MANTEEEVLNNQKTIITNQEAILSNQKGILGNQKGILDNQKGILKNQEVIVINQASIITNQKQIVDNQVALNVMSQGQVYLLNYVRKIAGEKESLKATGEFFDKLKAKAEKSVKSKKLTDSKKI